MAVVGLSGCALTGGGGSAGPGIAETAAPLLLPDLPPEVELVGMEEEAVEDLLGRPALQRAEQPAAYWRYSLGRCQLDVFLYPDPQTGRQEVAYFEVRPTGRHVAGRPAACADVARQLDSDGRPPVQSH